MANTEYASSVFINCPFDEEYMHIFDALIFSIFDCGFVPRCAMEIDDSAQVRIEKICKIIEECKFAVHDISRTELDSNTQLPRFNMPLELGMFLGARRFGAKHQRDKSCLILDREHYRFQAFISDIAGQDVRSHDNNPQTAVSCIRGWLNAASGRKTIPGGSEIWRRYQEYRDDLPNLCVEAGLTIEEMTFNDKATFASTWLQTDI